MPGTYEFVIAAPGYGLSRHTREFTASTTKTTKFYMATKLGLGEPGRHRHRRRRQPPGLIDDTEATNYVSRPPDSDFAGDATTETVDGRQVTIDLAGGATRRHHPGQRPAALRGDVQW